MIKNIILCPSSAGQKKYGVKKFPMLIKKYIKNEFNIKKVNIFDNNIFNNNLKIYNECFKYKKFISIGGDHSISIGTGASSLNKFKNTKFIWIDAHADINTYEESKTKNYHGMPLAYLTGLDESKSFPFIKNLLPLNNICYIGLRDIDKFESNIINKYKINNISYENFNPKDSYKILKKFIDNSPVHISFDVDSIDPKYISSTGTIVKNGLTPNKVKNLIEMLIKKENIIGLDIVEMNMEINKHQYNKSLNNFKYIFSDIFKE